MLKLLYFGIFSSTAKAAEFQEYKSLDEQNSTVFQACTNARNTHACAHACCLQIMLPVPLIKITWGQRKYM